MILGAALYALIGFVLHVIPLFSFFAAIPLCIAYYRRGFRFFMFAGLFFCGLLAVQYLVLPVVINDVESYQLARSAIYIRFGLLVTLAFWFFRSSPSFFTRVSIATLVYSLFWIPQAYLVSRVFEDESLAETFNFLLPTFSVEIVQILVLSSIMTFSFFSLLFNLSLSKILSFRAHMHFYQILERFFYTVHNNYRPTQLISLLVVGGLVYLSTLLDSQIFLVVTLNIFLFSSAVIIFYGYILFYYVLRRRGVQGFVLRLYPFVGVLLLFPYINIAIILYFLILVLRQTFAKNKIINF